MPIDNSSHDRIERSLAEIDWRALRERRRFTASPAAWEDQLFYFLLVDRFSDGREQGCRDAQGRLIAGGSTAPFRFPDDAYAADRGVWSEAGRQWLGGSLRGLQGKLGYLKRLGVTALWVSPIFKQVESDGHSYHGYGIQNFLDVDPHFGSRQDLIDLVDAAHALDMKVIADIIFNHAGDVFGYAADRYWSDDGNGGRFLDARWDGQPYHVAGWRNAFGEALLPFGPMDLATHPHAWPNDAVWPAELQQPDQYTRRGRIRNWDHDPELYEGDFETLKDIHLGLHDRDAEGRRIVDEFRPSAALKALCDAYRFWIAAADLDGFRVDTVKHMEPGAVRYFASVVKEYAQSLGKENFFLLGEITGGRARAFETLELTGLDAALGVDDIPDKLEYLAKGWREPAQYFGLFRNSAQERKASHVWFGRHVVTMFDDHDQVRKGGSKARFCAGGGYPHLKAVLALNLCSMGIPCLYYGTEQGFDGAGDNDRYLRECMFGGGFGSLQSTQRHFFAEEHEIYRYIADLARLRAAHIALRRGRQYLRQISASGEAGSFGLPQTVGGEIRSLVPWSRLFAGQELLLAINTDAAAAREAWVTIDAGINENAADLVCLYSTDPAQIGRRSAVEPRNGRAVLLRVPPGGFVLFGPPAAAIP